MRRTVRQTGSWRRGALLGLTCAAAVSLGGPAHLAAQAVDPDERPLTVKKLREALRDRDAIIHELARRVLELERRIAAGADGITGVPVPPPSKPPVAPVQAASVPEPAAPPPEPDRAVEPGPAAPGQFEVDEEAIDRALERTLVSAGVLLLPVGFAEVEPSFAYTRRVSDRPVFVVENGSTFPGREESRRNEFDLSLGLRVGLPFDSQFELELPYSVVDASQVTTVGGSVVRVSDATGTGLGDLSVGLAKTVLREQGWWPDLVARIRWDTDTGKTEDDGVALGGGFHALLGQISATKRQDPLAFIASAAYRTSFEKDDIEPGDELSFGIGAVLAASPSTSLRFVLTQQFADEVRVGGRAIDGSDRVLGTLSIGAGSVLGRGVLLDGALGVGLTDDAPDYSVRVSLPIRFGIPGL